MINVLWIPNWHPTPLNKLLGGRTKAGIMYRHMLKKAGMQRIADEAAVHDVVKASGPRKVDLHLVMEKGVRRCDRDAFWKVTLDGCKHAGLLVGDSPAWCTCGNVTYSKAMDEGQFATFGTFIILTDL